MVLGVRCSSDPLACVRVHTRMRDRARGYYLSLKGLTAFKGTLISILLSVLSIFTILLSSLLYYRGYYRKVHKP